MNVLAILDKYKKPILIVLAVVVVFVIWKNRNRIVRRVAGNIAADADDKVYLETVEKQINRQNLTYTDAEYQEMAARIYKAVKGVGTDEKAIETVFAKLRTSDDLSKLIATYGVRDKLTMTEWLYDDLNNKEIGKLNDILKRNGIKKNL